MTEGERRAKGMPPTPGQLAFVESMRQQAQENLAPMTSAMQKIQEALRPSLEAFENLRKSQEYVIPSSVLLPKPVRLEEDQVNVILERINPESYIELEYDWNHGQFTRTVPRHRLKSAFKGKEDNKRRTLAETLLQTRSFVKTATLASTLTCSEKQVSNTVAIINDRLAVDLTFPDSEPFIVNNSGKGYRINSFYRVYQIR